MAEGVARMRFGDRVRVQSAGSAPSLTRDQLLDRFRVARDQLRALITEM
jgi:hypothetical protein